MSNIRPSDDRLLADTYRILEALDEQGHALKAHDRLLRRVVTLKILPPWIARDPSALKTFLREIDLAARLKHPNLASVLGVNEDSGVHFVVMEYAEGSDLDRIVRHRGALSLDQALDIVIQAARGLEAAHARGIVHGALKPSRLMLDAAGTVRVLGVGQARLITAADPLDESADRRAADYMAPEQTGDAGESDPRADIYSLGCILYFLLTGREPFVGETLRDRLRAHRDRPAPELRAVRPDAPSTLEAAYQRMMSRRPEDRPASMTEVIELLVACKMAAVGDSGGTEPGGAGRARRSLTAGAGGPTRVFARGDDTAAIPIGPEFDLAGLGIDDGAGGGVVRASRAAESPVGLRVATSRYPGSPPAANPRRPGRPAIIVGLAAIAVVAAIALRLASRSGGSGSSPIAPPAAGGDGGPAVAKALNRRAEQEPRPLPQPEWIKRTIFDGTDAADWMLTNKRPVSRRHIQPDGLNPHGTGSYLLVYRWKLGDFILDFDYKLSRGCNSGVLLRVGDLDDPLNTGLEVSIGDSTGTGTDAPGAIHGRIAPAVNAQEPAGRWNHMTITAQGPVIAVSLNGRDVSRINLDEWTAPGRRPDGGDQRSGPTALARLPRRGYLGFQDLVGDCWFRRILLRTPKAAADRPASDPDR